MTRRSVNSHPKQPVWETGYADLDAVTFGAPSDEIMELARLLPQGASALDLGSGDGRNALYLAEHGMDVTAVDISKAGIRKLLHLATDRNLPVRATIADITTWEIDTTYDLIIAHGCLHLLQRPQWMALIERMKEHTSIGGYNVVAVFTDTLPPPDDLKEFCIGLFREGELFSYYEDWEIALRRSYILEDEHPGSVRHRHPINKIVARRR
jgi:tellurite methyltransferase